GDAFIYRLRSDSIEFDTVKMEVSMVKDTALVANLTVSNAPNARKPVFTTYVNSAISEKESYVHLQFLNEKGEIGLNLGLQAQQEKEEILLSFFPEHPIIGFRPFTLNKDNHVAFSDSGKVEAHVEMIDKYGTGIRLYSTPNEEAEQDLTIDFTRLNLSEIVATLPYLPDISGVMDAEFHYLNSLEESNTFSGILRTEKLTYNGYLMGDQELEAVYLPTMEGKHLVNMQWMVNDEVVATIDGSYWNENSSPQEGQLSVDVNLDKIPLDVVNAFMPNEVVNVSGAFSGVLTAKGNISAPRIDGEVRFDSTMVHSPLYAVDFSIDRNPIRIVQNKLSLEKFNIYSKGKNPFTLTGNIDFSDFSHIESDLHMSAEEYELLNAKRNNHSVLYGKVIVSLSSTIRGKLSNPTMRGHMNILGTTDVTYILKKSPLMVEDRLGSMVTFVNLNDTISPPLKDKEISIGGMDLLLNVQIDPGAQIQADLGGDNYVRVQGGGNLSMQYTPQGDLLLTGRYTLDSGEMKYSIPVIPLKTFNIAQGSYVDFTGNLANPHLNITATERVRTSVTEDNNSRYVNFDVGITITQTLENMGLTFTLDAPEDITLQNQLIAMSPEERGKLAVTMLVTGMYMGGQGGNEKGFNTNNALNSFMQNEISNIAGSALKTVDVSIGVEDNYATDGTASGGTDYSFRFAKRFWDNRLSVIIGGRISTGNEAKVEENESFIDDISLEWRLDKSGTRYVKLFHTKNYESILEGEIVETGVGLVLRRKVDKLGELFIFRRK
ncbi:MAG: translocation/assembly module TamB domain-containing protein, partial [Bacteroidaceae bacterium]|nr:translocation/assembly module TamB domain-containing protein [Bacteroidaceae bacterium]